MAYLTDRALASGLTLSDLLHIVIPSDVSQNPDGSSYKATIQQVGDALSGSSFNTYVFSGNADVATSTLTFLNNDGGTFTVTNSAALFSDNDINVTGGTYNPSTGCVTFTTNSGTTFDVCGFLTGFTDTNFANTDLTFDGNRAHDTNGFNYQLTSDGGLFAEGWQTLSQFDSSIGWGGQFIYTNSNDIRFYILNNETVRIDNSGNVGIGTTSPSEKLDVSGNTKISGSLNIGNILGNTPIGNLGFDSSGNVVTGTTGLAFDIYVTGGTFDNNTDTITFTNTSGGTFDVTGITDTNFANTNLTFTGSRDHDTNGNYLSITTDNGGYTEGWIYLDKTGANQGSWIGYASNYVRSYNNGTEIFNSDGILTNRVEFFTGGTTFNTATVTGVYFNVQTNTDQNSLYVNGTSGYVGIGTDLPSEKLHISGNTKISGSLNIGNVLGNTPIGNLGFDSSGNVVTGTTGLVSDIYVTGGTFDNNTDTITFTNTSGGTFDVTGITDTFVIAGTFNDTTNTLSLLRNDGNFVNITGVTDTFTGNTSGDCITDLYITNLYGCSPITVHDNIQSVTSSATGTTSFAFGFDTKAYGDYSHAEGELTIASGYTSHAEGNQTTTIGIGSHSEGLSTIAQGNYSHAEGGGGIASGLYSHTEGRNTYAIGPYSHAEGDVTSSIGNGSHAEGRSTTASGDYSHAEGFQTKATGLYSHAQGYGNLASGIGSHAEGGVGFSGKGLLLQPTSATTYSARAEGRQTLASGVSSHAEGGFTIASGTNSHAEGTSTTASNSSSHAEGANTIASGIYSHAEGNGSQATGTTSHAEGFQTEAYGGYSHTEGYRTTATSLYSHAQGYLTTTNGDYSHVGGQQNSIEDHNNNNIYGGKFQTISASTSTNGCNTVSGGYNNQIVGGFASVAMGIGGYINGSINYHFGQGSITDGTINLGTKQVVFGDGVATTGPAGKTNTILFDIFNGNGYWDGAADVGPADYAEYFEWNDGNTLDEDRVGYFVSLVSNTEKIEMSNNNVIGIVSAKPAIVGDSAFFGWQNRYVMDEWGRDLSDEYDMYLIKMTGDTDDITIYISENGTVYSEYPNLGNPNGVLYNESTDDKIFIQKTMVKRINPSYDPTQQYISRQNRPEWSPIGLLGKLRVKTAEQITGPSISVNSNGMAINGSDYPVLETIKTFDGSYGIVKVLFK